MGDISTERSMEDILSSIKRIIAEEGDGGRIRRPSRAAPPAEAEAEPEAEEEASEGAVLELGDFAEETAEDAPEAQEPEVTPFAAAAVPAQSAEAREEAILSERAAQATRGSLDALSRLIVKPEGSQANTLEELVRDMLRPMLSEWLDANLPAIVEKIVQREIERLTRR